MPQQSRALTDDELRGIFDDPRADLSLLSPDEHQRLLVLTAPDEGGTPSPSVMEESSRFGPGRFAHEAAANPRRPQDYPLAGATVGSVFGGPAGAAVGGATGALARDLDRAFTGDPRTPRTAAGAAANVGTEAALQGTFAKAGDLIGSGVVHGLTRIPEALMGAALGAQKMVRRKFPTVDLEDVALREGTLRDPLSRTTIGAKATAAGAAVPTAGRAADVAGTPPLQSGEVLGDLLKLRDRLMKARQPELVAALDDRIAQMVKEYGTQGIPIEDALLRKMELQATAASNLQGAANPTAQAMGTRAAKAEQAGITRLMHDPKRVPSVGPTLTRAQEMKALEKAVPNIASTSLASAQATIPYVLRKTLASPDNLARYGIAADRMRQISGLNPQSRGPNALTRASLLELLNLAQTTREE